MAHSSPPGSATKNYTRTALQDAVQEKRASPKSLRQLQEQYHVPKSTIQLHATKFVAASPGHPRAFTDAEETLLVDYLKVMCDRGFGLGKSDVLKVAAELLQMRPRENQCDNKPGDKWWRLFKQRHADDIKLFKANGITHQRANHATRERLNIFYNMWEKLVNERQYPIMWNCDEKPIQLGASKRMFVVGGVGSKAESLQNEKHTHISLLLCVSHLGTMMPSHFIIAGKKLGVDWGVGGDTTFSATLEGFSTMDSKLEWFKSHFLKHCGPQRPQALLLDGHTSNISLALWQLARDNNIDIIALPAHTSHVLQPLDVSVNAPLAAAIAKALQQRSVQQLQHRTIQKKEIPKLVLPAVSAACTTENILKGWSSTGLSPFNRDAVPDKRLVGARRLVPSHLDAPATPYNYTRGEGETIEDYAARVCARAQELEAQKETFAVRARLIVPPPQPDPAASGTGRQKSITANGACLTDAETMRIYAASKEATESKKRQVEENKAERAEKKARRLAADALLLHACEHCGKMIKKRHGKDKCTHSVCGARCAAIMKKAPKPLPARRLIRRPRIGRRR